jgi:hypothetical protein
MPGHRLPSQRRHLLACGAVAVLGACTTTDGPSPVTIPNRSPEVSHSLSIPADTIVLDASIFVIVDPLAPNWQIEQRDLGDGRYAITLKKKRFTTGGDGESRQVLRRWVDKLTREQDFSSHQVLEFSEGIVSNVLIAQRVATSIVQFSR